MYTVKMINKRSKKFTSNMIRRHVSKKEIFAAMQSLLAEYPKAPVMYWRIVVEREK